MANKRRDPLPRLSIAQNFNMQQPIGGPNQALYSPALPTSLQQSFHPAFPLVNPLQTPMQSFFTPQMPGAPSRPTHHAHQASIHLAAAGIHPPNLITPIATHFPRPSMMLGPSGQPPPPSHPFPNRNRRQLSVGGPPKAVLGGPARKVSPMPGAVSPAPPPAVTPTPQKTKKVIVNLPKETAVTKDGESPTRPSWARSPLLNEFVLTDVPVIPVDTTTAESYPPDAWRLGLPNSIDVYLPGKLAWDALKQKDIEEKLEKLGVERGSGSNVPHIHAPHARAASISSPADPALLLFKLNKLHQAQEANSPGNNHISLSPQPPFGFGGLSPSPNFGPRFASNRHGHTMSLVQPPSYQSSLFSASPSQFNPFGTHSTLGTESVAESQVSDSSSAQADAIHAPQGRIPMATPAFAPPSLSAIGGNASHVDFIRGFGLDVPLESEEEEEEARLHFTEGSDNEDNGADAIQDMELDERYDNEIADVDDETTTAPQSRFHSRHVSKISAALSLSSVGGNFQAQFQSAAEEEEAEEREEEREADDEKENQPPQNLDLDSVEEWTGSEDLHLETSDDESIGEWSNPSDEEQARQQRVERRMRRRAAQQQVDQPRRIPNFPRPPETSLGFHSIREDDIISNPSEENLPLGHRAEFFGIATEQYYPEPTSIRGPLTSLAMPVPHSRVGSSQYSPHDPAMAHSRQESGDFTYPGLGMHQSTSSMGRRDSLNPFAKPFVFGAPRESSGSSWHHLAEQPMPSMPLPSSSYVQSHSRLPSLGKPLNVAAPEFKPGGFSFHLPGAPQMPAPSLGFPQPLPQPQPQPAEPIISTESTPFKVQGREKRQRRGSSASMEEGDSMSSFKFPMKLDSSSPQAIIRRRRSGSFSGPNTRHELNPSAQPFTFAGFSAVANNMPRMPKEQDDARADGVYLRGEETPNDSSTAKADNSSVQVAEDEDERVIAPPATKQKRAPIPLDFKHPVSSNTVPAGLFKALVGNGDHDRTRRGVRSRLSSREIFEHTQRPSMGDDDVALIARNQRSRLVTDPGDGQSSGHDDVFGSIRHARRRSSLPDALHDNDSSRSLEVSSSAQDLSTRMSLQYLETSLTHALDERFAELRDHLSRKEQNDVNGVSSSTESMMADVISLFRAQLQESATRSLDDSQMDARGELDFQMIKDVVEGGHQELVSVFQREIHRATQHLPASYAANVSQDMLPVVEQVGNRTINAVVEAISELSARQEAVALNNPGREHDLIVDKLVNVLSPMIGSLQADPIDYDFLTRELTQSVKPHISQLIDLASDKRETASLIVDGILPLLPSLNNLSIDTDAITMKLITEVRRVIAPIDAFEIKEQVADLVVERLDSRLAVRDRAFNVDTVTSRVTDSVSNLLENLYTVPAALDQLKTSQKALDEKQDSYNSSQTQIVSSISELPGKVGSQFEEVIAVQKDILMKLNEPTPVVETDSNILAIKAAIEALSLDQRNLAEKTQSNLSQNSFVLEKINSLPEIFSHIGNGLQGALTDVISSRDNSKHELEELRKLNTEYQVQLTKARGSHGQVRVEKDALAEKFAIVEADRDRLRAQTKALQETASAKVTETGTLEARNAELEEALAKALARLQSADVATQANQCSIADLEKANKELSAEKQRLQSRVDSLEVEAGFANRERENASKALDSLQAQHKQVLAQHAQQSHWEALAAATEKMNLVFNLLDNAESEEQKELGVLRARSKVLEDENVALQKRFKELDTKLANSDKSAASARQSLTQAQQRSSEWERRAKEYEGQLERVQTEYEQSEQSQSQLDADFSMLKLQLEEQEADNRLLKDRESKLRAEVAALESKCFLLQTELEKASARKLSATPAPFRPRTNGISHPPRPDSRASTIYEPRADTPSRRISSYSSVRSVVASQVPETSVYDSIHAPSNPSSQWAAPIKTPATRYSNLAPSTPKARSSYNHYQRGPSPTPSTVSVAPTQGDDGWWE